MSTGSSSTTLFDQVRSFFEDDGWPIERVGNDLHTTFEGRHGRWHVVALVREADGIVVILSVAPFAADDSTIVEAQEIVVRASFGRTIGAFDLDLDSGGIRFRTSIDVHGESGGVTHGVLRHLVYHNVTAMDRALPALRAVIEDGVPAKEALPLLDEPNRR